MKRFVYTGQALAKPIFTFILFIIFHGLYAQQATLSVQGVLTKSDGTAVDDGNEYTLTFRLWNDQSSSSVSNKVHEETINDVSIVGGVYSVVLGVNGTPLNAQFNETYWLGVSVGTSSIELLPRPRLTHAPYALGIVGQNNTFPSTGPVKADAFRAKGGPAMGGMGPDANGFSFLPPDGDQGTGMYANGPSNLTFWVGGDRVVLSNTGTSLYGATTNFGPFVSNEHTVNGNLQVNGNSTTTGSSTTNGLVLTGWSGGGFSFKDDGAYDTGLFGYSDGEMALVSNGGSRILIGANGVNYINGATIMQNNAAVNGQFFLQNVPDFDGKNMQWNQSTGLVGADNSTRRAKSNIKPLKDDFSLILKAQPRTYTRKVDPTRWEVGYIAEEMDSLGLKLLTEYDANGLPDGFNYEKMILYVTEVLKMQHTDIETLQAEVAALKAENTGLKTENSNLRTDNSGLLQQQSNFNTQLEELSKRMIALEKTGSGK